jgi:hypothetical protein
MKRSFLLATIIVTALLAAGCTQQSAAEQVVAQTPVDKVLDLVLPGALQFAEQRRLAVAEESLVGTCMKAAGHSYPAPPTGLLASDSNVATEYALVDERVSGYGIAADISASSSNPPNLDQSSAANLALMGPESGTRSMTMPSGLKVGYPAQGCLAKARMRLYGTVDRATFVAFGVQDVRMTLRKQLVASNETNRARSKWAKCMRIGGLKVDSPEQLVFELRKDYSSGVTPTRQKKERLAAQRDALCDRDSRLRQTTRENSRALLLGLPAAASGKIAQLPAISFAAVLAADVVLKEHHGVR